MAGKLHEDLTRTVEQLAGQLAGVQEALRTLGDPAAATAQIEAPHSYPCPQPQSS